MGEKRIKRKWIFHLSIRSSMRFNWESDSHLRVKASESLPSRQLSHLHLKDMDLVLGSLDLSRASSVVEPSRDDGIPQVQDCVLIIPDLVTVRTVPAFPAPENPTGLGAEVRAIAITAACWAP